MKILPRSLLIICAMGLTLTSCKHNPVGTSPSSTSLQPVTRAGTLSPVQGATVSPADLEVVTFAASAPVGSQGNFSVQSTHADEYQQLFFLSKSSQKPVYIGLYDPTTKRLSVNDTSTVLSLLLFNPELITTPQSIREQYLQVAEQNAEFPQLLALYTQAVKTNADSVFSYSANPLLFQTAAEIINQTVQSLSSGTNKRYFKPNEVMVGGAPTIQNGTGDNIVFENSTNVYYGAGIYPNNGSLKDVVTINPQPSVVQLQWAWPPATFNQPEATDYSLGQGQFRIYLAKGLDFSKFNVSGWNDPVGRATICNTATMVLNVINLVIGFAPTPPIAQLPSHFSISASATLKLGLSIENGDALGFAETAMDLLSQNAQAIALWVWEGAANAAETNAAGTMVETLGAIAGGVTTAFKVISAANSTGPFFYDLIFAPSELNYYVTKQNGSFSANEEAAPSQPSNPSPSDSSNGVSTSPTLAWSCSDPEGNPLTYNVYLGTNNPPTTTVASNVTAQNYQENGLESGTTYYWQVVAKDSYGNSTPSRVWQFTTVAGSGGQIPTSGLVAYYPFNDNTNDESGNNFDGTTTATFVSDRNGNPNSALYFNGGQKFYATVTNKLSLTDVTLSAWIKGSTRTMENPRVVAVGPPGNSLQYYALLYDNGLQTSKRIAFYWADSQGTPHEVYSIHSVDTTNWHFIVSTFNGTHLRFYIDGSLDKDTVITASLQQFSGQALLQIGYSDNNSDWFKGYIDGVRIYDRALSTAEVDSLYHEGG